MPAAAPAVPQVRFRIRLSPAQYLAYYQGVAQQVITTGVDGRRIRFPAERLRPFVTHEGVAGEFELEFDDQHRFVALRRVGD